MPVVTNESFAHRGFIAFLVLFALFFLCCFLDFFTLTIFFPFVTLLGEWEEKLWENDTLQMK